MGRVYGSVYSFDALDLAGVCGVGVCVIAVHVPVQVSCMCYGVYRGHSQSSSVFCHSQSFCRDAHLLVKQ
jgi:hypothetical protein